MNYKSDIYRKFEKLSNDYIVLKDRLDLSQGRCHQLDTNLQQLQKSKEKMKAGYEAQLEAKDAIIKALRNELAHAKAIAGHDGTNTGIPTSQTPAGKNKVIPNMRVKSGKKKGGQPGHERHILEGFQDEEITDTVFHEITDEMCGSCEGSGFEDTGERIFKDENDIKIVVVKRRHEYIVYRCLTCGALVHMPIERRLKERNQYGSSVQAVSLSLMNTGNVPINKVRMMMDGLSNGQLLLSEGYIAKLQKRAAGALNVFMRDLKRILIRRPLLCWDDTVVMINKARACLRFYGDESIAYYTAHLHKDMESLEQDSILTVLSPSTTVMHDHNRVNYNKAFSYQNIECNQHLQRDLQKNTDNTGHTWSESLKELISVTIHERNEASQQGETRFKTDYVARFRKKLNRIMKKGKEEYETSSDRYSAPFENALLVRIEAYEANYFKWLTDFRLPTTDNLSERGLRCVKSHMKISGQFENEKTAGYFATIKTYIETCRKNGINEVDALSRLCAGVPYTVAEIFG